MRYKIHIRNRLSSADDATNLHVRGYVYRPFFWIFFTFIEGERIKVTGTIDEAVSELSKVLLEIAVRHQKKYDTEQELKATLKRAKVNQTNNILLRAWKLL